jgi:heme-degrading monooxygenase HmoA
MIARTWHGVTPAAKADAYYAYLEESGVKEYRKTPGNLGVYVLRRVEGDRAHFLLISLWDSHESIRAFAGAELEKARYFPKDREFLLAFEPKVTHYEVLAAPGKV